MAKPYFITATSSGTALIIGWGQVQDTVTPTAPSGSYVVVPSQAAYGDFLTRYNSFMAAGYGYLAAAVKDGPYVELLYNYSTGTIAEVVLSGGVPIASGSLPEAGREERNARLLECDWTQLPDARLTPACVNSFKTYRQALRDLPTSSGWPNTITWPTRPAEVKA